MKNVVLLLIFIFPFFKCNAQTINWMWASSPPTPNINATEGCITVDNSSNTYVTGGFRRGSITFGSYNLTCSATAGMFLAKYAPNGNVLWAKTFVGTTNAGSGAASVCTDALENVYIVGGFSDTLFFVADTLIEQHGGNIVLVKYDSSGNTIWARNTGGQGIGDVTNMSTDANGNSYITGYTQATTFTIGSFTFANPTGEYVFIAKYDSSGTVQWAKMAGSPTMNQSTSIAADGLGNVYLAGGFSAPYLVFGSDTVFRVASGTNDFLVKFDSSGNALWTKNIGINGSPLLATDAINNVYVANGPDDFSFLRKYNSAGNLIWERVDSADYLQGIGLATDKHNAIYYAGQFPNRDSVSIDAVTITKIPGSNATYIMKFDSSGTAIWGKTIQGGVEDPLSVAVASSGCVYAAGGFLASPFILDNDTLIPSSPNENVFVGKLCYTGIAENISETKKDNEVIVYPNPFTSSTTLQLSTQVNNAEVVIYDVVGKEMMRKKLIGIRMEIERGSLESGVYFVRVMSENRQWVEKLVVL